MHQACCHGAPVCGPSTPLIARRPAGRAGGKAAKAILRSTLLQVFSFKLRGAYNKMASLTAEQRERGVITSSAGNHAQGVSLAASRLVG